MKKLITAKKNNGQILVVILLIMIVGLTVGLFLMGRTASDISLTGELTESSRAFNAAEAGIEEAIRTFTGIGTSSPVPGVSPTPVPVASGISYLLETSHLGGGSNLIYPAEKGAPVSLGDALTVWLVEHNSDGSLNPTPLISGANDAIYVCFDDPAAVGVTLYYLDSSGQVLSAYNGYDPAAASRGNGFYNATNGADCGYDWRGYIRFRLAADQGGFGVDPATNVLLALRIRPLYSSSPLAVQIPNGITLPVQGADISSLGISGETSRKIEVQTPYKMPAPFMDQVIYSLSDTVGINK